jgi:hypothetical protein
VGNSNRGSLGSSEHRGVVHDGWRLCLGFDGVGGRVRWSFGIEMRLGCDGVTFFHSMLGRETSGRLVAA